jgi:hypothetical protein
MGIPPHLNKIAPSGIVKGQHIRQCQPSHLPEHPSAGIGTFFSVQLQLSALPAQSPQAAQYADT